MEHSIFSLDFSQLLEITGDDTALLAELMTDIVNQATSILDSMKQQLARHEFDALKASAHKFKSTVQYFGENELLKLMQRIESEAPLGKVQELELMVEESRHLGMALISQCERKLKEIIQSLPETREI